MYCYIVSKVRSILNLFFMKLKTASEMRISDWSSDVCSSDLSLRRTALRQSQGERGWNILAMDAECLQLGNQFIDIGDLDAGRADGGFRNLDRLDARGGVEAVIGGGLGNERLARKIVV